MIHQQDLAVDELQAPPGPAQGICRHHLKAPCGSLSQNHSQGAIGLGSRVANVEKILPALVSHCRCGWSLRDRRRGSPCPAPADTGAAQGAKDDDETTQSSSQTVLTARADGYLGSSSCLSFSCTWLAFSPSKASDRR